MVCVDFDGTILNFNDCLKNFLAKDNVTFRPEKVKFYDYSNEGIGCSKETIYNAFSQKEFYDNLDFFEGAFKSLEALRSFDDVYAYTGAVDNDVIVNKRKSLIKRLKLKGYPYLCTEKNQKLEMDIPYYRGGVHKPVILEADALFEDCVGVIYNWQKRGATAEYYLIDAPYNQEEDDTEHLIDWTKVTRCRTFFEAVDIYINKHSVS